MTRLRQKKTDDAVIVYLSTHAVVDGAGALQIFAYDSDPFAAKTLLPFKTVLNALKQCPARKKLLVLDIMPGGGTPLELGGTEDGVADLIAKELARPGEPRKLDDPNLAVLTACSPERSRTLVRAPPSVRLRPLLRQGSRQTPRRIPISTTGSLFRNCSSI